MSVKFYSWSRNWAGDEAGGISTGHIMNKGRSMKEGQCGTTERFEACLWVGDNTNSIERFHKLRIDTH